MLFYLNLSRHPFLRQPEVAFEFATNQAATFGWNLLRIKPDIVSKLLHATIWSSCAVQFESEQTPIPWTGRRLRSAALHRIQFKTCGFVPMSYFYSETNEWLQDWAQQWVLLWSATTSSQFHRNHWISLPMKKKLSSLPRANIYKELKTFLTVELSQYCKSGSTFSSSKPVTASSDCSRLGNILCLCLPVLPAQSVQESSPKSLAIDFAVKSFDCLPLGVIAR